MAAALIPQQKDTVDPFWVTAARQLFANGAGVLRERGVTENRVLVDHLLKTDLMALAQAMEGTVAQSIVDPDNPKTALSVRAMLTANIGALEYLPDTGPPFSIRDWVSDEAGGGGGGFLFLTSRGDQHASLRGLISTWLEIAVNAMLSLEQRDDRRIWVVLDELPTLHQVPSLQPGLAESRQFGGLLRARHPGRLPACATSTGATAPRPSPASAAPARCSPRPTATPPSGRPTASGAARSRRSRKASPTAPTPSATASRSPRSANCARWRSPPRSCSSKASPGWLRFPGPLPVAPIRLKYGDRAKAAERFVPRETAPAEAARPQPEAAGPETGDGGPQGKLALMPPERTTAEKDAGKPDSDGPQAAETGRRSQGRRGRRTAREGRGREGRREHGRRLLVRERAPKQGRRRPAKAAPEPETSARCGASDVVASIGAVAAPAQGASYYERDGYYAKDSPDHRQASAWAGRGAEALGLEGPVDPEAFRAVLEGRIPDGSGKRLGRVGKDGAFQHRPGRDLTFSAPKSVSLAALVGGDARVVEAHDRAVGRALDRFERHAAETRMRDPATGRMVRAGGQKAVIATFRHDASRNLDPALHTHAVIANMLQGPDGKWRTMANEKLYASKMLLGALYRNELAAALAKLGYGIGKTHADGRFEIAGVSRDVIDAFSTRRAEIEAALAGRGLNGTAENPRMAQRAALFTRAAKRDVDRTALRASWLGQAAELGFDAPALVAEAASRAAGRETGRETGRGERRRGRAGRTRCLSGDGKRCPCGGGGLLGGRASLGARGGVRPHRSARRRPRMEPGRRGDRRHRTRHRRPRGGRNPASRPHAGHGRAAHHRPRRRRRAGDDRPHARRRGTRRRADARPRRRQGPAQRTAHRRPEGGGEAHPVGEGPHRRRPGLRRVRQDCHAEPRPRAPEEEGLRGEGPRPLGLGRPHPRSRGRNRVRDPPEVPCPQRRRRRRPHDPQGRAGHARRLAEDRAGRGRRLLRLHRPDPRPAPDRPQPAHSPGGAGGRCEAARRG